MLNRSSPKLKYAATALLTLPGALRISPEELERRHSEITRDGEIVLYCT